MATIPRPFIFFLSVIGLCFTAPVSADITSLLHDLVQSKLTDVSLNPIILESVEKENKKEKTLEKIQARDEVWRATPGLDDAMLDMMKTECSQFLNSVKRTEGIFAEIFVMDNLGSNVCMTDKTSDYWQGDEPKFQESFRDGKGGIHIGKIQFDESTQAYLVQISLPIKNGSTVIGAITFGIDVEDID